MSVRTYIEEAPAVLKWSPNRSWVSCWKKPRPTCLQLHRWFSRYFSLWTFNIAIENHHGKPWGHHGKSIKIPLFQWPFSSWLCKGLPQGPFIRDPPVRFDPSRLEMIIAPSISAKNPQSSFEKWSSWIYNIYIYIYQVIGFREKLQEIPCFMGKTMLSCRFSLMSTHWISFAYTKHGGVLTMIGKSALKHMEIMVPLESNGNNM